MTAKSALKEEIGKICQHWEGRCFKQISRRSWSGPKQEGQSHLKLQGGSQRSWDHTMLEELKSIRLEVTKLLVSHYGSRGLGWGDAEELWGEELYCKARWGAEWSTERTEKASVGQQAAVGTLGKETTGTKAKGVQCVGRYELFTKWTKRTLCSCAGRGNHSPSKGPSEESIGRGSVLT